ncbi:MAG TPA: NAD(P)/FAD-dependent oxidoreductase [Cyclobacteriaceae bacterium]|nr:NAD(P)/FAD-dependent oxidoreductase [Cyclobacteriaceae bacterium]
MKRRKALEQIGWGLSGGILLPSLLDACSKNDPGPEVVYDGTVAIIGAGAAGLYAADILRTKGIKIKIFEAGDQIGGRVRSLRNQSVTQYPNIPLLSSDFPLELGAQTIIGTDSVFGKMLTASRLPTLEFPSSGNRFVMDNAAKSATDWGGDADFVAAQNFRANLKNNKGSTQTVAQAAAGINARAQGMLNGQIGNFYGGDNTTAGIGELAEEETLRISDGKVLTPKANPMQDTIISRFSAVQSMVQLNTPIKTIDHSGNPIILTAKDGTTFEADKVIVTVPISQLKSGLTFSAGLPGSIAGALTKFEMGPALRVILEFKKNFWGDSVGFIYGSSNVPEYLSMGMSRGQFNATLSVTVFGAKAAQYSTMGDGAVNAILADVDLLYAGQGTQFIRKDINSPFGNIYILHDWTKTDYIKGGFSYPLSSATHADRKALGTAVDKKLFFAGEATDVTGNAGMLNGALASAERVAEEVVTSILNP